VAEHAEARARRQPPEARGRDARRARGPPRRRRLPRADRRAGEPRPPRPCPPRSPPRSSSSSSSACASTGRGSRRCAPTSTRTSPPTGRRWRR
jgi:hypothetical protein